MPTSANRPASSARGLFCARRLSRICLVLLWVLCPALFAAAQLPFASCELPGVHAAMQKLIDQGEMSGVVCLVMHKGELVHYGAVGFADIEAETPMRTEQMFQIASMTKPMATTAVLMACEEKKLHLDDNISKYIPEFKDSASDPTLRQLLTHTSGLQEPPKVEFFHGLSLEDYAKQVAAAPRSFPPGSSWSYGIGISIAGRALEVAEGKPFEEVLQQKLLKPLGMTHTTFHPDSEQQKGIARTYGPGDKPGVLALRPTASLRTAEGRQVTANPSGGLFSTAEDLAKFYSMILAGGEWQGKRLLSQDSIEQMRTIQTGDFTTGFSPGNGWGLGWCVVRTPQDVTGMLAPGTFGHGGAWGTQGWIEPTTKTVYVMLMQRAGFEHNSDDSVVRKVFQQSVVDALRKKSS